MPVYVYETEPAAGKRCQRFEIVQKITDPPLTVHPKTGDPVKRVLFAPNTPQFKYDRGLKQIERETNASGPKNPSRKNTKKK